MWSRREDAKGRGNGELCNVKAISKASSDHSLQEPWWRVFDTYVFASLPTWVEFLGARERGAQLTTESRRQVCRSSIQLWWRRGGTLCFLGDGERVNIGVNGSRACGVFDRNSAEREAINVVDVGRLFKSVRSSRLCFLQGSISCSGNIRAE